MSEVNELVHLWSQVDRSLQIEQEASKDAWSPSLETLQEPKARNQFQLLKFDPAAIFSLGSRWNI